MGWAPGTEGMGQESPTHLRLTQALASRSFYSSLGNTVIAMSGMATSFHALLGCQACTLGTQARKEVETGCEGQSQLVRPECLKSTSVEKSRNCSPGCHSPVSHPTGGFQECTQPQRKATATQKAQKGRQKDREVTA